MAVPDDPTLDRLAAALARLAAPTDAVPTAALVELAEVAAGATVTVDFRASGALGHPLVVWRDTPERPRWWAALTARERDVALLVADGLSNAGIPARLGLAVGTVKDHVHAVLAKARFRRRSQVAAALSER